MCFKPRPSITETVLQVRCEEDASFLAGLCNQGHGRGYSGIQVRERRSLLISARAVPHKIAQVKFEHQLQINHIYIYIYI